MAPTPRPASSVQVFDSLAQPDRLAGFGARDQTYSSRVSDGDVSNWDEKRSFEEALSSTYLGPRRVLANREAARAAVRSCCPAISRTEGEGVLATALSFHDENIRLTTRKRTGDCRGLATPRSVEGNGVVGEVSRE
jgi:hypothetical protein